MRTASGIELNRARAGRDAGEVGGLAAARLWIEGEAVAVIAFPPPRLAAGAITPAERAIVEGILGGLSNAQIARQRHRSARTVANQVSAALRKLRVGSRAELLAVLISGAEPGARQVPPR